MRKTVFLLLLVGMVSSYCMSQQDFDKEWKQVQNFVDHGLPQSALKIVDSIYAVSRTENNSVQFLKAALYQIRLRSDYQENFMETSINQLNQELLSAREPVRQVLHSILAELYWRYYQHNRYSFLDRTTITVPDPEDISTWDLRKLVETTTEHYEASLEDADLLQSTALQPYDPILVTVTGSKDYRPTLYDLLAHRALDYFKNDEASLTRPADRFEVDKPVYFLPAADFVQLQLNTSDMTSLKFRALQVMQQLLAFHLKDNDPGALIDADLERLGFVWSNSTLPTKEDLYIGSLKNLSDRCKGQPASVEVIYALASVYSARGASYDPFTDTLYHWELKTSRQYCENAITRFPGTDGAKDCMLLLNRLLEKKVQVTLNQANLPSKPFLANLSYKNLSTIYFRVISLDPEENRNLLQKNKAETIIQQYLKYPEVISWEQSIPDKGDLQTHQVQVPIPKLSRGFYVLLAGASPEFSTDTLPVVYTPFWVTGISYVSNRVAGEKTEVYVLDREKGTPLDGVTATAFVREYDYSSRSYNVKELKTYQTGKEGYFSIPVVSTNSRTFYISFSKGDDRYYTENYFYQPPAKMEEKTREITYFFTDRSIYRPGQTIYFKGILLEKTGNEYQIKAGSETKVGLYDVNNQKISELSLITNEFGSFNGVFTSPTAVLTGEMNIRNESGTTGIRVEEYKRPRFEVKIEPLEGNYRLNEIVNVTGEARAYAGNPVDGAGVNYRVVRKTTFPYWRSWWNYWPQGESMEVTSGSTMTDDNGQFKFDFKAIPDLSIDPETNPVFNYMISIDVSDINGESHSVMQYVSVGNKAMYITTDIPDNLDLTGDSEYHIFTKNLNGRPVAAEGTINIYPIVPPSKVLRDRPWGRPDVFVMNEKEFNRDFPDEIYDGEDDPDSWPREKASFSASFDTGKDSLIQMGDISSWAPGMYLVEITSVDAFGHEVISKQFVTAFNPSSKVMPESKPVWLYAVKSTAEPGDTVSVFLGSAEKNANVLYEIVSKDEPISRQWIPVDRGVVRVDIPVKEDYRGNFNVRFMFVKGNRGYSLQKLIRVPYTNKELDIRMESFRDKLTPGQEEEWRIRISGKQGDKVVADLLASMYDASLDAFVKHNWSFDLYSYFGGGPSWDARGAFYTVSGKGVLKRLKPYESPSVRTYDKLNWFGFNYFWGPRPLMDMRMTGAEKQLAMPGMTKNEEVDETVTSEIPSEEQKTVVEERLETPAQVPSEVPVRRNFEETAFFFPDMKTDENGDVLLKFKVPESLTSWKFMGLAYTKDLKTGYLEKEAVTSKELMVVPNPPRFLRTGDKMSFSAKVVNMSENEISGSVKAEFFDALTMNPVDLGNKVISQSFIMGKGASRNFIWDIKIPEGIQAVVYRVVAESDSFSDGEEMAMPVLPNHILVTESLPLSVSGKGTRNFSMDKLVNSGSSKTIKDYRLTLEFTSNPAWYAVQALPYLMEDERESADALFTRLYANSLASWIANSSPAIKQVFESWKDINPDALVSNLEKNEELKSVILQETPWVLQARSEGERKRRIAVLFDINHMANEQTLAVTKLSQMQLPSGGWPWFKGMKDSPYITQNIITGIGRLLHLAVINLQDNPEITQMLRKGISYMDQGMQERYEEIRKYHHEDMDGNYLSPLYIQYIYGRSYFMDMIPLQKRYDEAFEFFKKQSAQYWLKQNKYLQGMIALALNRLGDEETPKAIIRSLKENSLSSEEMGMYWRDSDGFYWYELPVERQAMLIEAFTEVAGDMESVEKMKIWLLKQKQTQMWETSKSTADALYALLLRGNDLLASKQLVQIKIGSGTIDPFATGNNKVEAGTGYFQTSWEGMAVRPAMGKVQVQKEDEGVAWGGLYWQYFEDLDKITSAETPLSLEKKLFRQDNSPQGPVLTPMDDNAGLKRGDRVVVRIVLRVDRDMQFVHMKDMRAAAFEPMNVLSGYRNQGGLGYYEAPKDASMNFYFDNLGKGTYVFEYEMMATQKGEFSNGITTIQCQYAPEFNAHSEGLRVRVE